MDIEKVHPDLREAIDRIPNVPPSRIIARVAVFLTNLAPKKKVIDGVKISNTNSGSVRVRVYAPEGELSGAALLWIHGGGLIFGNAATNDRLCADYANEFKAIVVSVEYRLAIHHPFPAAIEDCYAAWQWIQHEAANLGVDPQKVIVAGQSAGAGLAAALVHRIHDQGGVQPVAQVLYCPMLDDRTAANEELDLINHRVWNNKSNRFGWSTYLGHEVGATTVGKYAVPARREDLGGLPRAWVSIGDIDLFYAECCNYVERLRANKVDCQFYVASMAPHGFENVAPDSSPAKALFADNFGFIRKVLSDS